MLEVISFKIGFGGRFSVDTGLEVVLDKVVCVSTLCPRSRDVCSVEAIVKGALSLYSSVDEAFFGKMELLGCVRVVSQELKVVGAFNFESDDDVIVEVNDLVLDVVEDVGNASGKAL